jgi:CRISPR-associated protein, Cas4 family
MLSISKTHYTRWRGCAKNAWLSIHKPELFSGIELSEFDRSVMESGFEVEEVARNLFSDGVLVTGSPAEAQRRTAELLAQGRSTLFQAQFERDQLLAAIDVLRYDSKSDDFSIFEIKSSTRAKEEHTYDLAFQVMLLRMHGFNVGRSFLVHLNPKYIRRSDLDIHGLFITVDMTARIDSISDAVTREIRDARKYLLAEVEPKSPCSCIYRGRSNHCSTFPYPNPDVPGYSVHDILHIGNSPHKLRALVDEGILSLGDVADHVALNAS